jgi:osmotically-inducible protein OsmY
MTLKHKHLAIVLAAAALATALAGCVPLVVGGAAVGATMVATDRRTSAAQLEDETIALRASSRVHEALGDRAHVNVTSYNRQVLLTGEVPTEQAKQTAEQIVFKVENVKGVFNELGVMPATGISQRSTDTYITGKVKASIVDDKSLTISAFTVVTERGTVYLMGRVNRAEADRATQIARGVSDVVRVVRLFEVITDQELKQIGTTAPSTAPAGTAAPGGSVPSTAAPTSTSSPVASPPASSAPVPLPPASGTR